jgi:trans-feruloyl-CoA hydratase/vanillin synthase
VAKVLLKKNPVALKATKDAVRRVKRDDLRQCRGLSGSPQEAANSYDDDGRKEGIKQFIDDKTYKPGLGAYDLAKQS